MSVEFDTSGAVDFANIDMVTVAYHHCWDVRRFAENYERNTITRSRAR